MRTVAAMPLSCLLDELIAEFEQRLDIVRPARRPVDMGGPFGAGNLRGDLGEDVQRVGELVGLDVSGILKLKVKRGKRLPRIARGE
jgi:hypothetical protein